jgi:alpha-tubulin suppressor-like RCC1 family protein
MKKRFYILVIAVPLITLFVSCKKDRHENIAEIKIAAGGGHSLIIKADNILWVTGHNFYGQLGDGSFQNRNYFVSMYLP